MSAAGIRLFLLPPCSPKLNRCVEGASRTHTEESYKVVEFSLEVDTLKQELSAWERTCITFRPHRALGHFTPLQSLTQR